VEIDKIARNTARSVIRLAVRSAADSSHPSVRPLVVRGFLSAACNKASRVWRRLPFAILRQRLRRPSFCAGRAAAVLHACSAIDSSSRKTSARWLAGCRVCVRRTMAVKPTTNAGGREARSTRTNVCIPSGGPSRSVSDCTTL